MGWCVYILRCDPDTLYTGSTPELERRIAQHCGRLPGGAKYTRSHPPKDLAALWEVPDAHTAHSVEWHIKRLSRAEKLRLLAAPSLLPHLIGNRAEEALPLDPSEYQHLFVD